MKPILIIFTGGTIGSSSGATMAADAKAGNRLISEYMLSGGNAEFETVQPVSVLSENMTPAVIMKIIQTALSCDAPRYSGIIITHGSDTLSYTSAFAGLLLLHLGIPVVLTAANKPVGQNGSNALVNFSAAVEFILNSGMTGAFTIYRSSDLTEVFAATRILEADGFFGRFTPFGGETFGIVENGRFIKNSGFDKTVALSGGTAKAKLISDRKIILIKPYPGLDYSDYSAGENIAAVLHLGYHSGTACTAEGDSSFLRFAERFRAAGIPVYVLPFDRAVESLYESAREMLRCGIKTFPAKISPESAYAKLWLAYNIFGESYITRNEFYEYI